MNVMNMIINNEHDGEHDDDLIFIEDGLPQQDDEEELL